MLSREAGPIREHEQTDHQEPQHRHLRWMQERGSACQGAFHAGLGPWTSPRAALRAGRVDSETPMATLGEGLPPSLTQRPLVASHATRGCGQDVGYGRTAEK